jgi:hypothetical protein
MSFHSFRGHDPRSSAVGAQLHRNVGNTALPPCRRRASARTCALLKRLRRPDGGSIADRVPVRHDQLAPGRHHRLRDERRQFHYGVVTMCVGGGQCGAALFERV